MGHALAEQRFDSYENVKKCLDDWFDSKNEQFFWRGIHKFPERWENVWLAMAITLKIECITIFIK